MKTSAGKAFPFDANGEEDSGGGTYIQPRDPGKVSFSSENNAANNIRVRKLATFKPLHDMREKSLKICKLYYVYIFGVIVNSKQGN
jgi:hypothetical protein